MLTHMHVIYFEVSRHDIEMMYDIHPEEMHNIKHHYPKSPEELYDTLAPYGVSADQLAFKNETGYPI